MHYYQHHIGDFIRDTANLSDHQLATYLRMIWEYYNTEKPLADDVESLAFAMRSDEKTVQLLLKHYFKKTDLGWSHSRCDREIEVFHGKAEKARNSANARWKNAGAMRTHTDRNANELKSDANQEPITKNPIPNTQEIPPADAGSSRKGLKTLKTYIDQQRAKGEKVISDDHHSIKFAEDIGLPREFLNLVWHKFKDAYLVDNPDKKYRDWPRVFAKAVKDNWFKLWYLDGAEYKLTTVGMQTERAMKNGKD